MNKTKATSIVSLTNETLNNLITLRFWAGYLLLLSGMVCC